MRKIIVTGATSFIAVPLIMTLLNNGDYVYAIIRPNSNNLYRLPINNNIKIIELDMKEIELLSKYIFEDIDILYHFAWEGIRGSARDDCELQRSNFIATIKVIDVAKKLNTSIFIGVGSQAEYGNMNNPVNEEQIEKPVSQYGIFKLKAKQYCEAFAKKENIRFIWVRIFSAYGKYDYDNSLIMYCIKKMQKSEDIHLTECIQKWDYIYVEDLASILYKFGIIACDNGVYNIGSGESRILKEYILELKIILQSSSELKFGSIPYESQSIIYMEPIVDKIKHALKCYPLTSFSNGIRNILNDNINPSAMLGRIK